MDAQLDNQAADLAWSIATGLKAGYGLREVLAVLASQAPQPAAAACQRLLAELEAGREVGEALDCWKQETPALARLADALATLDRLQHLDALSEELLRECGSDPAFYPAMRQQAEALGAQTPLRAREGLF